MAADVRSYRRPSSRRRCYGNAAGRTGKRRSKQAVEREKASKAPLSSFSTLSSSQSNFSGVPHTCSGKTETNVQQFCGHRGSEEAGATFRALWMTSMYSIMLWEVSMKKQVSTKSYAAVRCGWLYTSTMSPALMDSRCGSGSMSPGHTSGMST